MSKIFISLFLLISLCWGIAQAMDDDEGQGAASSLPQQKFASANRNKAVNNAVSDRTAQITTDAAVASPTLHPVSGLSRLRGLLGYGLLLLLAYLLSAKRRHIRWRPVIWGLSVQAIFALIVLHPSLSQIFFRAVDLGMRQLLSFAEAGISFVFQSTQPHQVTYPGPNGNLITEIVVGQMSPVLKSFAFWILPTIIFFSALVALFYHLGIMQWIVGAIARAMVYMLKTSGAETLCCTANIVLGQTEAPLLIRPFIGRLTQSEMMAVMVGGFGTISAGSMAVYVSFLRDLPGVAGHLMVASIMAAPCSLAVAKILMPETEQPTTAAALKLKVERSDSNVIEAIARGASEGISLVLNIVAVLIAFVSVVAMLNALLGLAHTSMQQIFGWVLSPLAWSMGVPWVEATEVGQLLGEKLILTELLAYLDLKRLIIPGPVAISQHSAVIAAYALSGFANIASIGVQIGGIGGMAPLRRGDLARLGLRAMAGGALVSCLSASLAGILVP